MARVSDIIENFIKSLLEDTNSNSIEIQRNELAQYFKCSPSQINYVLSTRFSNERGYYIESRRGGGGYIKIIKVNIDSDKHIKNMIINSIGNNITKSKSYSIIDSFLEKNLINKRESNLMKTAISDRALNLVPSRKNELRANILKDMLLVLLRD